MEIRSNFYASTGFQVGGKSFVQGAAVSGSVFQGGPLDNVNLSRSFINTPGGMQLMYGVFPPRDNGGGMQLMYGVFPPHGGGGMQLMYGVFPPGHGGGGMQLMYGVFPPGHGGGGMELMYGVFPPLDPWGGQPTFPQFPPPYWNPDGAMPMYGVFPWDKPPLPQPMYGVIMPGDPFGPPTARPVYGMFIDHNPWNSGSGFHPPIYQAFNKPNYNFGMGIGTYGGSFNVHVGMYGMFA